MQLRIAEPSGDGLGLVRGGRRLLRAADRAGDERLGAGATVGTAELEPDPAPLVDPLTVGLLLPADGAVEGGLRTELGELGVVRAGLDCAQHRVHERLVVEVERVCVGDLAPQPGATSRVGLELDRALEQADLLVERVASGSQLGRSS